MKEHLLAKCIFGCLLSILRYLTRCLSLICFIGGNQKNTCFLAFLRRRLRICYPGDSGVHMPESLVRVQRLQPKPPGSFFVECRSSQIWGRRLWAEALSEACLRPGDSGFVDLPRRLRALGPGDSGLKRQQRLVLVLDYK